MNEGRGDEAVAGPVTIAGRYELRDVLGRGSAGVVHAARDRLTGSSVAVKILAEGPLRVWPRVRRELMALRMLRLPGVVNLLDDGVHEGSPFLVMSLVHGRPFPGVPTPATWDAIAPAALSLLETLARVHAAGVVHRDLKPSNVLCDEAGGATLVDFGLAWGPDLGGALTEVGSVIGTPDYMAPEQFATPGGDARSDLYSVGVMLYDALAGRVPHTASDMMSLMAMRRSAAPTPLRHAAPGVPPEVARVVDQLLAIDPADRPQTASEALRLVSGRPCSAAGDSAFVRIDGPDLVQRVVAAAESGESVDVFGPTGSGRTRLLAETSDRLAAAGRDVRWVAPAPTAYGSLATVVGELEDLGAAGHDEARATIRARLAARLSAGTVVVADDPERIDRWSAELLASCRDAGTVLRVVPAPTPGCIEIRELTEQELRPLFAGPDRLFHLREDAARELWHRTGGLQARVVAEIAAWVRSGLAHWREGRLEVSRENVDRLHAGLYLLDARSLPSSPHGPRSGHLDELLAWIALAWPNSTVERLACATDQPAWRLAAVVEELERERMARRLDDGRVQPLVLPHALQTWSAEQRRAAHVALSRALPPGTPFRLRHLAAAGEPREVVEEALLRAPTLADEGRRGDALIVLELGLAAARDLASAGAEERLLVAMARVGLACGQSERVRYETARAQRRTDTLDRIDRLLAAAHDAARGDAADALARLDALGPFPDAELERQRQAHRVEAAMRLPAERAGEVIDGICRWADSELDPRAKRSAETWRALHLRRCGRPDLAAPLFLQIAEETDRAAARVADLVNAMLCFIDSSQLDDARRTAIDARAAAAQCRHAAYEAYAEIMLRQISYRSAETAAPDLELVDAVGLAGDPVLEGLCYLTESAIAWRSGRTHEAASLARRSASAAERAGARSMRAAARALELVCGAKAATGELDALIDEAQASEDAGNAAETLGLLALADPCRAHSLYERVRALAPRIRGTPPDSRLQILSLRESLGEVPPAPLKSDPRPF